MVQCVGGKPSEQEEEAPPPPAAAPPLPAAAPPPAGVGRSCRRSPTGSGETRRQRHNKRLELSWRNRVKQDGGRDRRRDELLLQRGGLLEGRVPHRGRDAGGLRPHLQHRHQRLQGVPAQVPRGRRRADGHGLRSGLWRRHREDQQAPAAAAVPHRGPGGRDAGVPGQGQDLPGGGRPAGGTLLLQRPAGLRPRERALRRHLDPVGHRSPDGRPPGGVPASLPGGAAAQRPDPHQGQHVVRGRGPGRGGQQRVPRAADGPRPGEQGGPSHRPRGATAGLPQGDLPGPHARPPIDAGRRRRPLRF